MNRMLVVIFNTEKAAEEGVRGLRALDVEGNLTLYAMGVVAKDAHGKVTLKQSSGDEPIGTGVGMGVGAMIGLLGGPVGVAVGAVTGTLGGAIRDFWTAGVGLDFVEEAQHVLTPGKVALIAEVDEDWVIPVDTCMAQAGGSVYRRARSAVAYEHLDHDVTALKAEMAGLEAEVKHGSDETKALLHTQMKKGKASLDAALHRTKLGAEHLKHEADAKVATLKAQIVKAEHEAKAGLEKRMAHVRHSYDERSTKLAKAWGLTKQALAI